MNRTTNEVNSRTETRCNSVTAHESAAAETAAPAESERPARTCELPRDFPELLLNFAVERPYSLSEDGHTALRQLRGAIVVLSTLSAEGQTRNGLIELDADALYNLLSMLDDKVNDVLKDAEDAPGLLE